MSFSLENPDEYLNSGEMKFLSAQLVFIRSTSSRYGVMNMKRLSVLLFIRLIQAVVLPAPHNASQTLIFIICVSFLNRSFCHPL